MFSIDEKSFLYCLLPEDKLNSRHNLLVYLLEFRYLKKLEDLIKSVRRIYKIALISYLNPLKFYSFSLPFFLKAFTVGIKGCNFCVPYEPYVIYC